MRALALAVEDDAIAEFSVPYALSESYAHLGTRGNMASRPRPRAQRAADLDAWSNLLDQLGGNLANEARWLREVVHTMQSSLLGVGEIQNILCPRYADIT